MEKVFCQLRCIEEGLRLTRLPCLVSYFIVKSTFFVNWLLKKNIFSFFCTMQKPIWRIRLRAHATTHSDIAATARRGLNGTGELCKSFRSFTLTVYAWGSFKDSGVRSWMRFWLTNDTVWRTGPASPDVLNIF